MSTNLPTDIDATFPDRDPGDAEHQRHHDAIHAYTNEHDSSADPHGDRAYADTNKLPKSSPTFTGTLSGPKIVQSGIGSVLNVAGIVASNTPIGAAGSAAGGGMRIQAGSSIGTTDANGKLTVTFPAPFPKGVDCIILTPGDHNTLGQAAVVMPPTLSGFSLVARTAAGAVVASAAVRVNWLAIGS